MSKLTLSLLPPPLRTKFTERTAQIALSSSPSPSPPSRALLRSDHPGAIRERRRFSSLRARVCATGNGPLLPPSPPPPAAAYSIRARLKFDSVPSPPPFPSRPPRRFCSRARAQQVVKRHACNVSLQRIKLVKPLYRSSGCSDCCGPSVRAETGERGPGGFPASEPRLFILKNER